MGSGIARLNHRSARNASRYGGKGAGLARLVALGFDVPPGFIVPARTAHEELPALWSRRLVEAFHMLGGPVAVRSSLVGEDSALASLAGQLESVLDVGDEEAFLAAVRHCYASARSTRVREYRRGLAARLGAEEIVGSGGLPTMALVVQRMQPARVGGVAFSADPISGRRCVIIEATCGRTERVVAGTVVPTRWVVDARGQIVDTYLANGDEPPLARDQVLALARSIRRIGTGFGHSVDVEWLHDGERFWFLQARPITTLVGKRVYSSRLVSDMSPGLIKPLLWSTNTQSITQNVFGRLFGELIGPNDIDFTRLVRRIHSRLYADVTGLGELLVAVGLPENFFEMMAKDEHGERPRLAWHRSPRLLRFVPFMWRNLRARKALQRFVREQDDALSAYRRRDWADAGPAELRAAAEDLLDLHGRSQWFVVLAAINLMVRKRLLARCIRRHVPGVSARDLLQGLAGLKALEPNEMLQEAGTIARRLTPAERKLLDEGDDVRIRATLAATTAGIELIATIDAFMTRYGFLSANGTDFSSASWVENPTLIWQSVARHARIERAGGGAVPGTKDQLTIAEVAAQLPPLRRRLFQRFLASTRSYLDLRERASFLFSEDTYQFRRVVLAMGTQLVTAGRLDDRDDVFCLYRDELWRLVAGELDGQEARRLVTARQAEMAADAACEPDETLCGEEHELAAPAPVQTAELLVGIGGSPGLAEGYARIVRDPLAAPADLGAHDILVVPFTDVGWTPLMAGIAGIVAEAGGQLSHTAIVAREYGLPAVVSVRRATQVLHDGEAITLDGRHGRVYRGHVLARKEART